MACSVLTALVLTLSLCAFPAFAAEAGYDGLLVCCDQGYTEVTAGLYNFRAMTQRVVLTAALALPMTRERDLLRRK